MSIDTKKRTQRTKPREDLSRGDRISLRLGRNGTLFLSRLVTLGLRLLASFMIYIASLYVSTAVVPNIAVMMQRSTGVNLDSGFQAAFAFWMLPTAFLVALLFVLVYAGFRALWRATTRLVTRVQDSLLRLNREEDAKLAQAGNTNQKGTNK